MSDCHPERKHKAKGLCRQCYEMSGRRAANSVKATCHPERAHQAKGLCKPCYMTLYHANYQRPEPSVFRRKESSWANRGIIFTVEDYERLLAEQGGGCAICMLPPEQGRWHPVDHCHETGAVRGILCDYCNRRLMIPRNTPEVLLRAAAYITNTA